MSFCFGVAAGPSGSRGARAVRARAASFAPQAQAPGRCTVPCLFVLAWRQDRAGRAERELFVLAQRALRRRRKPSEGAADREEKIGD